MKTVITALATASVVAALAFAASASGKKATYLVSSPHTAEECLAALDEFVAYDKALLHETDWGCRDGDHTGYLRVHADNAEEALQRLPEKQRKNAKVVRLGKFTAEEIRSFHEKQ